MQIQQNYSKNRLEQATLGGGCFWCLEAVYQQVKGVVSVVSGYAGGHINNPSYEEVCTGTTGHAEVVQITFVPDEISYREILEIFFAIHDPTTLNRQGADVGTQYRSVIFFHSEEQHQIAQELIEELNAAAIWPDPIITQISPFKNFYQAEDYHQNYFKKNPAQPYCQVIIAPKVAKFRQKFTDKIKN